MIHIYTSGTTGLPKAARVSNQRMLVCGYGVLHPWDAYFVTGDVVKMHEEKRISFCDRSSDSFRRRSENVATQEVENILNDFTKIEEVRHEHRTLNVQRSSGCSIV